MPHGGKLTIETSNKWIDERAARRHDLAIGQYVSLCVSDTGTGMHRGDQRLSTRSSRPNRSGGHRLGLSMIYGFVGSPEVRCGSIRNLGKGLRCACTFPARRRGTAGCRRGISRSPVSGGAGEVVLVIDDDATVRMLVSESVRTWLCRDGGAGRAIRFENFAIKCSRGFADN